MKHGGNTKGLHDRASHKDPQSTDLRYLVGWFLPEFKGDHRRALQAARQHRRALGLDTDR